MNKMLNIAAVISLFSCNFCQNSSSKDNLSNNQKLETSSCMIISILCIEATDTVGKTVYLDSEYGVFSSKSSIKKPWMFSGSGCILDSIYFGTVEHVRPSTVGAMISKIRPEDGANLKANMETVAVRKGLNPYVADWRFVEINSYVLASQTNVEPIQKQMENEPLATPDEAFHVERQYSDSDHDVAVYKFDKRKTPKAIGFSRNDLATQDDIKLIKNGSDIETWGYPINVKQLSSGSIETVPDLKSTITQTPGPGFNFFGTNIRTQEGASGSFVLHVESNKIIGLVLGIDGLGTTRIVPSNYLRDIYDRVLADPNR